jgi:hypothetical protein
MREHYGLDRLIEQGTQPLPETLLVVNPTWRRLDQSVRRERARLYRLRAEFGARTLPAQPSAQQVQNFERRGGELRTGGLRPRVRQAATRHDELPAVAGYANPAAVRL